jgi:hypothetical protein
MSIAYQIGQQRAAEPRKQGQGRGEEAEKQKSQVAAMMTGRFNSLEKQTVR